MCGFCFALMKRLRPPPSAVAEGSGKPLIFQIEKHANKDLLIFSRYSNIWMLLIYIRCTCVFWKSLSRSGCLVSVLVAHKCTAVVRTKSLFFNFLLWGGGGEWSQRFWVGLHTSANKGPRCFPKQYFLCTPPTPTPQLQFCFWCFQSTFDGPRPSKWGEAQTTWQIFPFCNFSPSRTISFELCFSTHRRHRSWKHFEIFSFKV